jgi:hypothetical protein
MSEIAAHRSSETKVPSLGKRIGMEGVRMRYSKQTQFKAMVTGQFIIIVDNPDLEMYGGKWGLVDQLEEDVLSVDMERIIADRIVKTTGVESASVSLESSAMSPSYMSMSGNTVRVPFIMDISMNDDFIGGDDLLEERITDIESGIYDAFIFLEETKAITDLLAVSEVSHVEVDAYTIQVVLK